MSRWKLLSLGVVVVLLVVPVWWTLSGDDPEPTAEKPVSAVGEGNSRIPAKIPARPRHRVRAEECADCPALQSKDLESMKRTKSDESDEQISRCIEFLREAASNGIPNPDTSHLGGCDGQTPLHFASTVEEVQALLDAGADVNARDQDGWGSLHRQIIVKPLPTEEDLAIVKQLLEAGAEVHVTTVEGAMRWEELRQLGVGEMHLDLHNYVAEKAAAEGVSMTEYIDARPGMKKEMEKLLQTYLIETQIRRAFRRASDRQANQQW